MARILRRGSRGNDVEELQAALNRVPPRYVPTVVDRLAVDGVFGRLTQNQVRIFQKNAGIQVDGLVGPQTRAALDRALVEGGPDPETSTPAPAPTPPPPGETDDDGSAHDPKEIERSDYHLIEGGTQGTWGVDLIEESRVRHGRVWHLGSFGDRLILEVLDQSVIFYVVEGDPGMRGKVFIQTRTGFRHDVRTSVLTEAAAGAEGMVTLAEIEAHFMLGALSAFHVSTAALVISLDALRIYAENRQKIEAMMKAVDAVLEARRILKRHAPTLWDKIVHRLLFESLGVVYRNLDTFLHDPNRLARISGAIVSGLGVAAARGRLTALKLAVVFFAEVAKGAVIQATVDPNLPREKSRLIMELRQNGVPITEQEADRIIEEVEADAPLITRTLEKLRSDLQHVRP